MAEVVMSPEKVVLIMAGRWCDECKMELGKGECGRCVPVLSKQAWSDMLHGQVQDRLFFAKKGFVGKASPVVKKP